MLCGAARRTINPEVGHHLAGYGPNYTNDGVHDDLAVSVLYLSDGAGMAVLINYDLIGMGAKLNGQIRAAVGTALGLPAEQVFLTCTHTHSGPEVRDYFYTHGPCDRAREDYNARLLQWTTEAAREARQNAEACELYQNFAQVPENMNRRYSFPDRQFMYTPDRKQLAGLSSEFVDRELGIIAFRKKGSANRYKALITNYAAHPLCVGNSSNLVSADYQGVLRRTVEETFAGCICLSTTGAAGDLHPLMPEAGFSYAEKMGTRLGETAIARTYDAVRAQQEMLRLCYKPIALPARDEATSQLLPCAADRKPPECVTRGISTIQTAFSLLGIGPVLLVGVPGELVGELGATLKWCSPFLKTYVLFQATDNVGYIPAGNQYLWGGYEAISNPFARRAGELLVRGILDQADELIIRQPLQLGTL